LIDEELEEIKKRKLQKLLEKQAYPTSPILVNEGNFDEIIKKYPKVVIDCYADWCNPCKMIAPMIEEFAKEFFGKIVFGKLNVDENMNIAMRFNIKSIPTLLIFKNGKLVNRIVGALPRNQLKSYLQSIAG
jgi:thioredoxin 1